jgi:D-alanyl-D-alanine carboxypeptidase
MGMSRRGWGLVAAALVLVLVLGIWQWRRYAAEQARIVERDAAALTAVERDVASLVARARADALAPGISAAFALPDGRIGTAVSGFADVEAERLLTPDTRFLAGSVGKSFHAALAVWLASEGVVDLDAPISRWLGEEKWFERLPNGRALTLRHLLQHRSGLIDHVWTLRFVARELKLRFFESDELIPTEEMIEIALDREPKFRAGEGFAYGDTNYLLAGLVMKRATGRSDFDLIEEHFLARLGLDGIVAARSRRILDLAAGYQLPVNPFLLPPKMTDESGVRIHPMLESTAGGFAANPRSLVRWAKALFEGAALPDGAVQEMIRNTVPVGDGRRYGLGLYEYDTPLGRAYGHSGYFPGYRSGLIYYPDAKIAIAVQTNRDFAVDTDALLLAIAQRVIGF